MQATTTSAMREPPFAAKPGSSRRPRRALPLADAAVGEGRNVVSASATAAGERLPLSLYRPRPGHPDLDVLQAEARAMAASLRGNLDAPDSGLGELRRRASSYATAARNLLDNRARARAGREDLFPLYFIWTLLRGCNFACTYCDDHRGRKYPDLPSDGVLDTAQGMELLRIMRSRTPSVYFAGGEPLMRRDLPELTHAAHELGYHPIIVNTNGSAIDRVLRRESYRRWLAETDVIVVSLDALDLGRLATLYDYARPVDVVRNLLLLRELASEQRFKLMVNCVIQPGHLDDARDVLDLANDLGIWFCAVPMNVGPRVSDELSRDPAYRALAELILERKRQGYRVTGSERLNRRLLAGAPLDCRNTLKPHVDFDGHLYWPCKASVNVEPERIRVLDYLDVEHLYEAACARVDPTHFHGPAKNQCGGECNWAQNYTTDAYAHGLAHPASLLVEVVELLRSRA